MGDYITKTASIGHIAIALQANLLTTRFNSFHLRRHNKNQHAGTGRSKDLVNDFADTSSLSAGTYPTVI